MEDKFGWQSGQIIIKKKSKNAKGDGYNPNRDPESGRFTFGSGGSLNRDMTQVDTSYRGSHGAPNRDDETSAPGYDLQGEIGTFPEDIYSPNAARLYSSGYEELDRQAIGIIQDMRGQKNKKVMVYRAVPNKADIEVINPGDWVSITKGYADAHGESNLDNNYKVLVKEVRAKDIWNDGNSIQEWGYDPDMDFNYIDGVIKNGPGYNPNRDPKTGRFTFGSTGPVSDFGDRDASEAEDYINDEYKSLEYTEQESEDLRVYASEQYTAINNALRRGDGEIVESEFAFSADYDRTKRLDAAINKNSLKEDTYLYRGMSNPDGKKFKPGEVYVDHAFSSTSMNEEVATSFFGDDDDNGDNPPVLMVIKAPKGTKAAIPNRADFDSNTSHEVEMLLGRNTAYRVDSVRQDTDMFNTEYTVVEVEVIS